MEAIRSLISPALLTQAIDYPTYHAQVEQMVAEGRTSGPVQNDYMAEYTRLNWTRMKRLYAHTELLPEVLAAAKAVQTPQTWLVLTEAWCGDAAQNLPVIALIAQQNPLIDLRLIYRDEHPAVMDAYLTNGTRGIPKLIALHREILTELGTWGPRPASIQQKVLDTKAAEPELPKTELSARVQQWYTADKTASLQAEFLHLLRQWA